MVNVSIIQESIDLIDEDTEVANYEFIDNVLLWSKYTKLKRAFIVITAGGMFTVGRHLIPSVI